MFTVALPAEAQVSPMSADSDVPGQRDASADIMLSVPSLQPVPGRPDVADGYFTIENHSNRTHLLIGITSPTCQNVIARHTDQQPTEQTGALFSHLALPRHTTMVFAVGGYHFVCQGMKPDTVPGQSVPVTFSFLGGSSQTIQFPVEQPVPR